ncbi:MAG TPA: dTMP kinase, partial [Gammaproteobacteria bacterium]|nr:dTMP kinase [Gammaproteobacteria bacterium]
YLQMKGEKVVLTREPGGTALAEELRELRLNPEAQEILDPKAELLLMFAGRAQHLAHLILPELAAGKWVICDRFVDATYAYQGAGRGLDNKWIQLLEEFVVGSLRPVLTILLDLDPALGLARSKRRGPQDRFEKETLAFFSQVRHAYLDRARKDRERFRVIEAGQPLLKVQAQLQEVMEGL